MPGGPREEARPHLLRNPGSCLELEEPELSGGGKAWTTGTVEESERGRVARDGTMHNCQCQVTFYLVHTSPSEVPPGPQTVQNASIPPPPQCLPPVLRLSAAEDLPESLFYSFSCSGPLVGAPFSTRFVKVPRQSFNSPPCPALCPLLLLHPSISLSLWASPAGLSS